MSGKVQCFVATATTVPLKWKRPLCLVNVGFRFIIECLLKTQPLLRPSPVKLDFDDCSR